MRTARMLAAVSAAVLVCVCLASVTSAATFYVDPVNGSPAGDGSAANPWRTMQEVVEAGLISSWASGSVAINPGAPITGGDTVLLRSGYHGEIILDGYYNRQVITIEAEEGHTPQIKRIRLKPGSFWTFRGLTISPSFAPVYEKVVMFDVYSRFIGISRNVTIEDCFLFSVLDASGWSAADWVSKSSDAIRLGESGQNLVARNNKMLNVSWGVYGQGTNSLVEYNEVTNFSGDGIRATGPGSVIQYNLIRNNYNVDDNHDDGIQGFLAMSSGSPIADVVLRGNLIINREDPNQPHPGPMQGIGCFDGMFQNWLVENNVVITDHWNAISFLGATDCTIINNTVFSPWYHDGLSDMKAWIQITKHKNGTMSSNCVVRNNIAPQIQVYSSNNINATVDHNILLPRGTDISQWFVDADNWDLRLLATCPAVSAGTTLGAPVLDADENHRPIGLLDCGAYEFGSIPPTAANAGDDYELPDAGDDGFEFVFLDGSGSYSFTSTITDYMWSRNGTYVGSGAQVGAVLAPGENTFTLRITTADGDQFYDDITITVTAEATRVPGDADGDGDVDLDDFVALKLNFGVGDEWAEGDFDEDGDVDLDDFVILKNNFGA